MKSQDVAFWKEAINDEMDSIIGNNTWVFADLLPGCKPLGCKSIFKRKLKDKDVYMNQPQAFIMPGDKNKADRCVYRKFDESGKGVVIRLYVDDMLIFCTDQVQVNLAKEFLSIRFSIKDLGEADVIFVIRVKHEMSTPMDTNEKLRPNNGQTVSQLKYSRVIGCLMYVITCTRPSIAFIVAPGKEAEWLRNLILEIPMWSKPITPIFICCDSAATLAKAYSQIYNGKSRRLSVRHSMIRELIMNGVVSIEFVSSQQNLVDHLTMGLATNLVIKSVEGMSLKSNLVVEC
uniref:Zinc finger, CCHC-type n=1 Tax=Tanacetum cinerariifolium TaxID=118510 RepID=A0A699GI03_TANCI|nr:zinc finger, CCHC-type [Tanacetum cinerariifolium]